MSTDTKEFNPPLIRPGEIVLWSADGSRNSPYPAIVIKVSRKTAMLWEVGNMTRQGVRYIDDPALNDEQISEFGCWFPSETVERLAALEAAVTDLTSKVAILESAQRGSAPTRNTLSGKT